MLPPLISQGGVAPGLVDVAAVLLDLLPALNANGLSELTIATEAELYEYADDGAKRLARNVAVFVERDAGLTVVGGTPVVAAPARHLSTIHASHNTASAGLRPLRPANVAELQALDVNWPTAAGTPSHFTQDQEGTESIRVYKTPASDTPLAVVFHEHPPDISKSTSTIAAPSILSEFFFYFILGETRRKESDESMPEVAEHAKAMTDVLERVLASYWGRAQ